jgi:calcineurin-like phosphoesterase family protein
MDEEMIRMWNEKVDPHDVVYHLGDVAFCNVHKAAGIMRRLNGKKILIAGNHDRKLLEHSEFRHQFMAVHDYFTLRYKMGNIPVRIAMFHYPIHEWDQCHRGAIHCHGHVHGKPTGMEKYRCRDVGMDATGNVVTPIDDIIVSALKGEIKSHGDGEKEI